MLRVNICDSKNVIFTYVCIDVYAFQTFRQEFEEESVRTGKPRLLITIAVAVGEDEISRSYVIPEIST